MFKFVRLRAAPPTSSGCRMARISVLNASLWLSVWITLVTSCIGQSPQCSDYLLSLKINTAHITFKVKHPNTTTLSLKMVSAECYKCSPTPVAYIAANQNVCTTLVDTRWPTLLSIVSTGKEETNCTNIRYAFKEGENYTMSVYVTDQSATCYGPYGNSMKDINVPVYGAFGILGALAVAWICYKKIRGRRWLLRLLYKISPKSELVDPHGFAEDDLGSPTLNAGGIVEKDTNKKDRLKSLDTFRGISLVIMMFVNYGGGQYWYFNHSKWNGLTVADLVFPWFVWIMGTAMAYSFKAIQRSAPAKHTIFWKIIKRAVLLFLFGLLINSSGSKNPFDFKKIRIMGVLQRFSLTYLVVASVHMFFSETSDRNQYRWWSVFRDIVNYWPEWVINGVIVILHLLLTFLLPVPGCPTGYLGAGGLSHDAGKTNVSLCTGGAAGHIDRTVFGAHHVYGSPSCKEVYHTTIHYDPEGLLGTLTSCFLCFLGLQAGKILIIYSDYKARIRRFLVWGLVLGILATILCRASKNEGWIPVNKNLWSLSFVLVMSSFAFVLLAFCYLTIDVFKIWTGAPFYYPGMNSIVVYMCHEILHQPFQSFWNISPGSHAIALTINIWDVTVWILLSYFMFRKQIFISI